MSATVTWITGLSGAGKTTLAQAWVRKLQLRKLPVVLLDGDELREVFDNSFDHSLEQRYQASLHYARLCRLLSQQSIHVVCATISLFHETQEWNRTNIPNYFEVYIKASLPTLLQQDSKNIYQRALSGKLQNVVGVDLQEEVPKYPDLIINREAISFENSLNILKNAFFTHFNNTIL